MAEPITKAYSREIQAYREMAESCRKMAAVSRRPDPLLLRAQAFEATALATLGKSRLKHAIVGSALAAQYPAYVHSRSRRPRQSPGDDHEVSPALPRLRIRVQKHLCSPRSPRSDRA